MIAWIGFCVTLVNIVDKTLPIFCGALFRDLFLQSDWNRELELTTTATNAERNVPPKYKNKIGLT